MVKKLFLIFDQYKTTRAFFFNRRKKRMQSAKITNSARWMPKVAYETSDNELTFFINCVSIDKASLTVLFQTPQHGKKQSGKISDLSLSLCRTAALLIQFYSYFSSVIQFTVCLPTPCHTSSPLPTQMVTVGNKCVQYAYMNLKILKKLSPSQNGSLRGEKVFKVQRI